MDTRFWGPSAWIMLHSVAILYTPNKRYLYKSFYENLKNVLPCIYCRVSFTEYVEKIPIDTYLDNSERLSEWIYLIHNLVNEKLRSQGLLHDPNPTFSEVYKKYKKIIKKKCSDRSESILGWNFLYSIAFNYADNGLTNCQYSHYNGYFQFFNQFGYMLPPRLGKLYNSYISKNSIVEALTNRKTLINWMYNLENHLKISKCPSLDDITNIVESYRAGCGGLKRDLKPTCRRIK